MARDELMWRQASVCRAWSARSKYRCAELCSQGSLVIYILKDALKIKLGHILISRSTATALWTQNSPGEVMNEPPGRHRGDSS